MCWRIGNHRLLYQIYLLQDLDIAYLTDVLEVIHHLQVIGVNLLLEIIELSLRLWLVGPFLGLVEIVRLYWIVALGRQFLQFLSQ